MRGPAPGDAVDRRDELVQIMAEVALPVNTDILVVAASNPSGSSMISLASVGSVQQVSAKVGVLGAFNIYTVQALTITSGDFIVGFGTLTGAFPADIDRSTPSQKRSYVSTDTVTYSIIDSFGPATAGNFGIRAVVTL